MSVLVPSIPSSTNTPHHYFSNGNSNQTTKSLPFKTRSTLKLTNENENDHVPFGVVSSMKQRLLDKVNESLLATHHSTLVRHSLSKTSARLSSNENLLQTKSAISPLKHSTRLSRSQDSLLNNNNNNIEAFTSYLQPKQEVVIVDADISNEENISNHRHSYTELHVDEVPKPGTVTTVKNMFERQIRLSRFDSDKLSNATSRNTNSQHHRDVLSPNRSRSISPNDMALRQRRAGLAPPTLSLPVATPYPDLVTSHTPPIPSQIEVNKSATEQTINENKKKDALSNETTSMKSDPNLLLSTNSISNTSDYKPLDFKSRLALFNQTTTNTKRPAPPPPNFLTKPVVHHHNQHLEKADHPSADEAIHTLVNTSKAVTFFGGTKLNEANKSSLPASVVPPPVLVTIVKEEQSSVDLPYVPDIIGGYVKLNKSSLSSGIKKEARVQFMDNVHTFEYPSFNIIMAEFSTSASDNEDEYDEDEEKGIKIVPMGENIADQIDDMNDDELDQLARINAEFNTTNSADKALQPKGSGSYLFFFLSPDMSSGTSVCFRSILLICHKQHQTSSWQIVNAAQAKREKSDFKEHVAHVSSNSSRSI
ncbi:unnamed protein product [Adineta ricciae]|uniref:Uncharacterized protein n=1 Tax=Adineta ricciae TaxID=249248 RepID=A0A814C4N2_ADIRI|nr:unnamed protein product [Adineta ricciae]